MGNRLAPLTLEDGEDISRGLTKGLENKDIAASIGWDESVVSGEIARHDEREAYRACKADSAAREGHWRQHATRQGRKAREDPGMESDLDTPSSTRSLAAWHCHER